MKFLSLTFLSLVVSHVNSFTPVHSSLKFISIQPTSNTRVYNVPPPGTNADAATLKDAADRESPPQSFYQLQANCARATELAIKDGHKLLEIEVRFS